MKNLMISMMSIGFALMLYGSLCNYATARVINIDKNDSTIFSTRNLTINDNTIHDTNDIDTVSQVFAKTLEYVSQVSKRSCTEKEEIAKAIYEAALENNIDICFILAQGTIETQLGSTGIGKSRKSIFGVYKTYPSYTVCIKDYARILKKFYLTRGRTEKDLLRNYVTVGGTRYAGNRNYEITLRSTLKKVQRKMNV